MWPVLPEHCFYGQRCLVVAQNYKIISTGDITLADAKLISEQHDPDRYYTPILCYSASKGVHGAPILQLVPIMRPALPECYLFGQKCLCVAHNFKIISTNDIKEARIK